MSEETKRSYAKESTKSKPVGVRFDLDKLELVKTREKLNTNQKVVDFLLNKYWWECKIAVPTHKEVPPLALKAEIVPEVPKQVVASQIVFKSVSQWVAEKRELESEEEFHIWEAKLDADTLLTDKQKKLIKIS